MNLRKQFWFIYNRWLIKNRNEKISLNKFGYILFTFEDIARI